MLSVLVGEKQGSVLLQAGREGEWLRSEIQADTVPLWVFSTSPLLTSLTSFGNAHIPVLAAVCEDEGRPGSGGRGRGSEMTACGHPAVSPLTQVFLTCLVPVVHSGESQSFVNFVSKPLSPSQPVASHSLDAPWLFVWLPQNWLCRPRGLRSTLCTMQGAGVGCFPAPHNLQYLAAFWVYTGVFKLLVPNLL